MRNNYYVYSNVDTNGKSFYIGKGTGMRGWRTHDNDDWKEAAKDGYTTIILVNGVTHKMSHSLETNFVKQIGIENLTNSSKMGAKGTSKKNNSNWDKFRN